ncbi:MAG: FUSC family protein, partial [Perlucidibaca sp.]
GILCVTVVSDAIMPERLSPRLVQAVRGQFRHLIEFLREAVAAPLDRTVTLADQIDFVSAVLTLESLRASTLFEDPESRLRSDRLRLFNADFMTVSTTLHALQRLAQRLRAEGRTQALAELRPCVDSLAPALLHQGRAPAMAAEAVDVIGQLQAFQATLAEALMQARARLCGQVSAAELFDFDCTAELFEQFVDEMLRFTETYASLMDVRTRPTRPAPAMSWHSDPLLAFGAGLRAMLAMLVVVLFWIASGWPEGAGAATIACVGCALFASAPAPLKAVRQMVIGFLLGLAAAYACGFHVLNQLDGFLQLSFGLLPFMLLGAWLMAHPASAGMGAGFSIMFTSSLQLQNVMHFNAVSFINGGLAQLLGLGVAAVAFSVLATSNPAAQASRIAQRLRRELVLACTQPLRQLPHAFDGRVRDLMRRAMSLPAADRDRLLPCALSVLELGDAIADLRLITAGEGLPACLRGLPQALVACFRHPGPEQRRTVLAILHDGLDGRGQGELTAGGRLARCLHRIHCGLADDDWYAAFNYRSVSVARTGETQHAS